MQRQLATILAADIVGYSAQMETAEEATIHRLMEVKNTIHEHVSKRDGRIFSEAGDGFLSVFSSPVSAVRAGFEIQRELNSKQTGAEKPTLLRIGIHLADVVLDGNNYLGDGVNIASRVESAAEPGSVFITQTVFDQVKRNANLMFECRGEHELKNLSEPMVLYRAVDELGNHSYITSTFGDRAPNIETQELNTHENSIAVLLFDNMSTDPEQDYFAEGFCEDLITELARFTDLFVLSRNTSFALKGRQLDIRQIGEKFGVSYCLEGSVRKMGKRIRLTAQLVDTRNGDHVWAEKYDFELNKLFDVQDELASSIVGVVAGRVLQLAEISVQRKKPKDMEAYDCLIRGLHYHRLGGVTYEAAMEGLNWFNAAIEKDPEFGRAHAWRACALATAIEWTGSNDWDPVYEAGRRAISLDNEDAECHRIMGSLALYSKEHELAKYHFEKALQLNPNHVYVVGRMGELYNYLGEPEKALEFQLRARQLDPFLPEYCRELEAVANYLLGRSEEALRVVSQLSRLTRRAAAYAIAASTHTENDDATDKLVKKLMVIDPNFTVRNFMLTEFYKDESLARQLETELSSAGLPIQ